MSRPKISALIHTRNESRWIADCVRSVTWADEVVIADMASTDDTREQAVALGARIIEVPLADCVDKVRNLAVDQCRGDWILVVDADERVSSGLAERLRTLAETPMAEAFAIPRHNYLFDHPFEHLLWPDYQIRFFRTATTKWSGVVHEPPLIQGRLAYLPADHRAALEHPGSCFDIQKYLIKFANYSRLETERMKARDIKADWLYLIRRPTGEFFDRYFGGGWREGMPGLVMCLLLANNQLMAGFMCWAEQRLQLPPVKPATLRRGLVREICRTALKALKGILAA